jgi:TRAP-type C4-dicarboxylate transport system substrate-binding protein
VVQIGWVTHGQVAGRFVAVEVAGLPFVSDESEAGSAALWRLYESGALSADFFDLVPLWVANYPANRVHLSKPPKTLYNLQGSKIAVTTRMGGVLIQKLGGTPITMIGSEFYEALQRRTIDGVSTTWAAFSPYKLHEVVSFTYEAPLGSPTASWVMTRKLFDSLPSLAKKVLIEQSGERQSRAVGKHFDQLDDAMRQVAKKSDKHEVRTPEPAILKSWSDIANLANDEWLKERPGTAQVLTKYRELLANVRAGK